MSLALPSPARATMPSAMLRIVPGLAICVAVSLTAYVLQALELRLFGRAWLEALVIAILLGAAVRTVWTPDARWRPGIGFSARTVLEIAVVLLGASLSLRLVASVGLPLLGGIALVVAVAIAASYGCGRLFGLSHPLALLIACGNSICGNSAIASVAPVIGARSEDVATSIGFTAVLGVAVVLLLPPLGHALGLHVQAFGILSGLTVYAVPQVVAATAPFSAGAVAIGTLVKLMRVLMLGPVIVVLSFACRRSAGTAAGAKPCGTPAWSRMVPWFIPGFLALMLMRSAGAIPVAALEPIATTASVLTVLAMAALGLETDLRSVARAGGRAMVVVTASLLLLGAAAFGLLHVLALA